MATAFSELTKELRKLIGTGGVNIERWYIGLCYDSRWHQMSYKEKKVIASLSDKMRGMERVQTL